jgi:hypothetical protein
MNKIFIFLSFIAMCSLSSCMSKDEKIMYYQTHFTMQDLHNFVHRMNKDQSTKE